MKRQKENTYVFDNAPTIEKYLIKKILISLTISILVTLLILKVFHSVFNTSLNNKNLISTVIVGVFMGSIMSTLMFIKIVDEIRALVIQLSSENVNINQMQNEYFDNDIYKLYQSITKLQSSVATNSRLAAIGQTTQLLAHDIRTPFSQILMLINYFEMDQCDPNIIQAAKLAVRKSINHVESIVNDIMDYSREICLSTSAVPIGCLINSVLTRTLQANPQDQIAFLYDFSAQYMPLVEQDRVERALGNIIGNAIEAITVIGGKDNGTISISSRSTVINNKKMVEIVIGNDGPPFAEGSTEKMFDSFYTHGKSKGTGLGLASAKKIIDLHQGNIISRNKADGKGVEFVINLPASDKSEIMMFDALPQNSQVVCRAQPKNDLNINQLIQIPKSSHKNKFTC